MSLTTPRSAVSTVAPAAKLFRGFGDRTRLAILVELTAGERRVSDLVAAVEGTQGNVSGHLRCLKECGLVLDRAHGREVFYRVATPEVVAVLRAAEDLLAVSGDALALCHNYEE